MAYKSGADRAAASLKNAGGAVELAIDPPNSQAQERFYRAKTRFVAYGGARGGGKSHAARTKAVLMAFRYPGIKILLLRRTYTELLGNHILPVLELVGKVCAYSDKDKLLSFPGGSTLRFGYCDADKDVLQYMGQEYDVIFLEEATQFSEYQYLMLTTCLRGANDYPKRFYLTCNPGGVGHAWVKRLFISRDFKATEKPEDYTFVPAKVYDNVHLMQKDPDYVRTLENLPPELRRAHLEGDWDSFAGQYFGEWRRELHTMPPFALPEHWARYYTMDYGLDMLAAYWIAIDDDGRAYVYREIFEGKDNDMGEGGGGLLISQAAERVLNACAPGEEEKIIDWFAPPDLWNRQKDSGRSAADIFEENGICLTKAGNDRIQGWLDLREWLRVQEDNLPRLRVFDTCVNLIESMPNLLHDLRKPNDCAKEPHRFTHAPDALRYFAAGQPEAGGGRSASPAKAVAAARYNEQIQDFLHYGM